MLALTLVTVVSPLEVKPMSFGNPALSVSASACSPDVDVQKP